MAGVEFEDFSIQVKKAIEEKALKFLELAASEIQTQAARTSRVDTGQLKGSWTHIVDEAAQEATIGSPLENAIWEEFGTGEYAAHGDGRKGGWVYEKDGETVFTRGKFPQHTLQNAFEQKKGTVQKLANRIFGELDKE